MQLWYGCREEISKQWVISQMKVRKRTWKQNSKPQRFSFKSADSWILIFLCIEPQVSAPCWSMCGDFLTHLNIELFSLVTETSTHVVSLCLEQDLVWLKERCVTGWQVIHMMGQGWVRLQGFDEISPSHGQRIGSFVKDLNNYWGVSIHVLVS